MELCPDTMDRSRRSQVPPRAGLPGPKPHRIWRGSPPPRLFSIPTTSSGPVPVEGRRRRSSSA
uniref:Uncharacterized protein n=1 Tax=Triticum urartu TaxID=4572 RepID=A0A8R7Q6W6_TRIUA